MQGVAVGLFAIITLSPFIRLKLLPYVDWFCLLAIAPVILTKRKALLSRPTLLLLCFPVLLVMAALLVSSNAEQPLLNLVRTGKLFILWVILFPLLISDRQFCNTIFDISKLLVLVNAAFLLLDLLGVEQLGRLAAIERWETVLSPPGPLSGLGAACLTYSLVAMFHRRSLGREGMLLFGCSSIILILTASRTSTVVAALGSLFAGLVLLGGRTKAHYRRFATRFCIIFVVIGLSATVVSLVSSDGLRLALTVPERLKSLIPGAGPSSDATYFHGLDSVRLQMNQVALEKIAESPFWGRGLGDTTLALGSGQIVVHNAFLQAWADLGLIGGIAFFGIYVQFVFYLRRALRVVPMLYPAREKAFFLQSLSVVATAGLIWLLNAFSTELCDHLLILAHFGNFYRRVCQPLHATSKATTPGSPYSIPPARPQS